MPHHDSTDKIISAYFAAVTAIPFVHKGKRYEPKRLRVSPQFFHEYTCKMGCAGCCAIRFSLDYLPSEVPRWLLEEAGEGKAWGRDVVLEVAGTPRASRVVTYSQRPQPGNRFCDHVNRDTGACMVHGEQPFTCDFETLRFTHTSEQAWLGVRPYGRGWNMMRVDGERGAICDFPKTASDAARDEGIRKLERLEAWARHFGLSTYLPQVIAWARSGPHKQARTWYVSEHGMIRTIEEEEVA